METGKWRHETGNLRPESGNRSQIRGRKVETGDLSQKAERGDRRPETGGRGWKVESGNLSQVEEAMDTDGRKVAFRERTKVYAASIVRLFCTLPKRTEVDVLGRQMLRSGTSVAANYREASRARSRNEFVSKIEICAQEADETILWLELLRDECGIASDLLAWALRESDELIAILVTMAKNAKGKDVGVKRRPETGDLRSET